MFFVWRETHYGRMDIIASQPWKRHQKLYALFHRNSLVAAQYPGPKSVPRPKFVENKGAGAAWKHHSPHTGRAATVLSQLRLTVGNFWMFVSEWCFILKYFLSPVFIVAWWQPYEVGKGTFEWWSRTAAWSYSPLQGVFCYMEQEGHPAGSLESLHIARITEKGGKNIIKSKSLTNA